MKKVEELVLLVNAVVQDNLVEIAENDPSIAHLVVSCVHSIGEGRIKLAEYLIDVAWEQLHAVHYHNVRRSSRVLYTIACYLKYIASWYEISAQNIEKRLSKCTDLVACLDRAIIMVDTPVLRDEVREAIRLMCDEALQCELELGVPPKLYPSLDCSLEIESYPTIGNPIERYDADDLTLSVFQSLIRDSKPFIITGSMENWPALSDRKWSNLNYLFRLMGKNRLVPIEVGRSYTDNGWSQKLINVQTFFDTYLFPGDTNEKGYLAQYDLFNQMPQLSNDVFIPDYCFMTGTSGMTRDLTRNAWFGSAGTISPLHTDPQCNLFAQIVGYKYIRLFSPEQTPSLYPYPSDKLMSNTSQIDLDNPDHEKFPLFGNSKSLDAIIGPGDLL